MKYSKIHFGFSFFIAYTFIRFVAFRMKSMDQGDDLSYWLHSATLSIDGDLDYIDDYKIESEVFHQWKCSLSLPDRANKAPFVFILINLIKLVTIHLIGQIQLERIVI